MKHEFSPPPVPPTETSADQSVVYARIVLPAGNSEPQVAPNELPDALAHLATIAGATVEITTTTLEEDAAKTKRQQALEDYAATLEESVHDVLAKVTPQQWNVIKCLVEKGGTNAQIGKELFIAGSTVQAHLQRICERIDVGSRYEIIAHMLNAGSYLKLLDALGIKREHENPHGGD